MNPEEPRIVRVGISTVVVGLTMFSPFLFYGVTLLIKAPEQLTTALFNCALYPALVYLIAAPKVTLEPNRLRYQWLAKKSIVDLPSVLHVWVTAHNVAPTLEFRGKDNALMLSFIIKPFSLAGIASILQHIHRFSPEAEFDDKCDDLLRGDTSSVTREVLAVRNLVRLAIAIGGAMFLTALIRNCSR
jgi:hypothetical protein